MLYSLLKQAWDDTLRQLGGTALFYFVIAVPLVGLLIHYWHAGAGPMTSELEIWLIYGLAATGAVFLVLFTFNLIAAPFRLERAAHIKTMSDLTALKALIAKQPDGPRLENFTFMSAELRGALYHLLETENVTSLTDTGFGEIKINFQHKLDSKRVTVLPVGATPQFEVIEVNDGYVHLKFSDLPSLLQVRVDGPIKM